MILVRARERDACLKLGVTQSCPNFSVSDFSVGLGFSTEIQGMLDKYISLFFHISCQLIPQAHHPFSCYAIQSVCYYNCSYK